MLLHIMPLPADLQRFLASELGHAVDGAGVDGESWQVESAVWRWTAGGGQADGAAMKGSWFFLTIAGEAAEGIRSAFGGLQNGWGSVRVAARIGNTSWQTSLFPSRAHGGYLLPLKASVRRAERLHEGQLARVMLSMPSPDC